MNSGISFFLAILLSLGISGQDIDTKFKNAHIAPYPIKTAPPKLLKVEYPNGIKVQPGDHVNYEDIVFSPTEEFEGNPDSYYNLILLDIDGTTIPDRLIYVWGVGNIRGGDVSSGHELAPYSPVNSSGHRLVMLVYQQPGYIKYDKEDYAMANARVFDTNKFIAKHDFTGPLFGNYFIVNTSLP